MSALKIQTSTRKTEYTHKISNAHEAQELLSAAATKRLQAVIGDALLLVTRCTKSKNAWVYEGVEFWKTGTVCSYHLKSAWLQEAGVAREAHPPFAVFKDGQYNPISADKFAQLFAEWISFSHESVNREYWIAVFMAVCQGDVVILDDLSDGRPKGL